MTIGLKLKSWLTAERNTSKDKDQGNEHCRLSDLLEAKKTEEIAMANFVNPYKNRAECITRAANFDAYQRELAAEYGVSNDEYEASNGNLFELGFDNSLRNSQPLYWRVKLEFDRFLFDRIGRGNRFPKTELLDNDPDLDRSDFIATMLDFDRLDMSQLFKQDQPTYFLTKENLSNKEIKKLKTELVKFYELVEFSRLYYLKLGTINPFNQLLDHIAQTMVRLDETLCPSDLEIIKGKKVGNIWKPNESNEYYRKGSWYAWITSELNGEHSVHFSDSVNVDFSQKEITLLTSHNRLDTNNPRERFTGVVRAMLVSYE